MKDKYELIFRSIPILENNLKEEFIECTKISDYIKGDVLVNYGDYLKTINLVIEGNVRVFIESGGKEVLMYYLNNLETCPLSLSASFDYLKSPVSAIISSETAKVLTIPIDVSKKWVKNYPSWSFYSIKIFRTNYLNLVENFSDFVFMRIKHRLIKYIEKYAKEENSNEINVSHQFLANELGTSREVISRILKDLEVENVLQLGLQSILLIKK